MKKFLISAFFLLPSALLWAAGGGADYGRGAESDPVATNALVAVNAATNALNTRVGTAETTLSTATGNVAALQGQMTAAQAATNALNTRVGAAEETLAIVATQGQVYASADITIGAIAAGQLITTNSFQAKTLDGANSTDHTLMRVWLANAANAVAHTGVEVQKVVDKQDYWVVATNNGEITFTITEAAVTTNTVNVSVGPRVSSDTIPLIGP